MGALVHRIITTTVALSGSVSRETHNVGESLNRTSYRPSTNRSTTSRVNQCIGSTRRMELIQHRRHVLRAHGIHPIHRRHHHIDMPEQHSGCLGEQLHGRLRSLYRSRISSTLTSNPLRNLASSEILLEAKPSSSSASRPASCSFACASRSRLRKVLAHVAVSLCGELGVHERLEGFG